MGFKENLKKFRNKKNLTQQELGDLLGRKQITIARYENGEITPPLKVIEKIAKILNISSKELIEEELPKNYIQPSLSLKLYDNIKASQVAFDEEKLNKIIEKQLISKELSNSLTQYFKAQNKEYNDEEIRDLIEQTFIFLEVLTSKKSK